MSRLWVGLRLAPTGRRRTGRSDHIGTCSAHYAAFIISCIRNNHDSHDVSFRVRMPLWTFWIGIVRRAGCGMQEAVTGGQHGVSEYLGWVWVYVLGDGR